MVAVLVSAATVAALVVLWRWIDGLAIVDAEKRATAELDALKLAASIVVGGGGLFALYLAARRQRTQEMELDARHAELAQRDRVQAHAEKVAETNRLHAERVADDAHVHAEAQRVTELYAKSVEQLGAEKAPVRLGGLYALERLAQGNPHQRQTVVNVLCAYLRMPFDPPGDLPAADVKQAVRIEHRDRVQELQVRMTAQRILTAHLRPGRDRDRPVYTFWPDTDLDLTDATLLRFDLDDCRLREARFYTATFAGGAGFNEATFTGDTEFSGATFEGPAWFGRATFDGPAHFEEAAFREVAWFEEATFGEEVWFSHATFATTAGFNGTTFSAPAGFSEVTFAKDAGFRRAVFCGITEFGGVTLAGTAVLSKALVVQPVPLGSSWPSGWRPAIDSDSVEGRKGTWHRLIPIDSAPSAG